jgi:hypothetical protein
VTRQPQRRGIAEAHGGTLHADPTQAVGQPVQVFNSSHDVENSRVTGSSGRMSPRRSRRRSQRYSTTADQAGGACGSLDRLVIAAAGGSVKSHRAAAVPAYVRAPGWQPDSTLLTRRALVRTAVSSGGFVSRSIPLRIRVERSLTADPGSRHAGRTSGADGGVGPDALAVATPTARSRVSTSTSRLSWRRGCRAVRTSARVRRGA